MRKLFSVLVIAMLFCLVYGQATADVPHRINYQGKLTDANGGLIVSDSPNIVFNIYADSTGETSLWYETHYDVPVNNGLFSVVLGSQTAIPDSIFDGSIRYLGITVGTDAESEPLTPIVSVGYAYRALRADTTDLCITYADSDWVIADTNIYRLNGNIGIGTDNPGIAKLAVMNGNVGIGTIVPTCRLQVEVEEDSSTALCVSATGTETHGITAGAGGGSTAGGKAVAVKGVASGSINGRDAAYGGMFLTQPIFSADKNFGVWAHGSATSSDTTYGVYARGSGEWSDATFGVYGVATCTSGTAYGVYGEVPANVPGYAGFFDGEKSYFSGKVGIGNSSMQAKLDVFTDTATAIKAKVDADGNQQYAGHFDAVGEGTYNIGVFGRGGCDGWQCTPASNANIGVWGIDGSKGDTPMMPSGNWAGYFSGDVRVKDSLDVGGNAVVDDELDVGLSLKVGDDLWVEDDATVEDVLVVAPQGVSVPQGYALYVHNHVKIRENLSVGGTLELTPDYDTSWVDIDEDEIVTLTHSLGGDPTKYIVLLYGKSTNGGIHQANYGTNSPHAVTAKWYGCEWYGLTSTQIKIKRAPDDDEVGNDKDWDKFSLRILKNQ